LIAKLILAAIALAVGVGGIWLLFIGVAGLVSMLEPKWRDRILPWVFAGPALALLAVFLVYPAAGTILRSFQDEKGQLTLANFAVMAVRQPPSWIVYAPLPPLFLMLLTGLYMFVLPYVTWRGRLPADFNREDANSR